MSMLSLDQISQISQNTEVSDHKGGRTGPYQEGNLKLLDTIECPTDVMCCRYSPEGEHLAVGLVDGTIKIYGVHSTHTLYSLSDEDTVTSRLPVTQIRFLSIGEQDAQQQSQHSSYEHRLMASYMEGMQQQMQQIHHPSPQHRLVASYASGLVKFWHYTSGKCLHTINEVHQTLALAMNPEGTHFLTAGASTQIHCYDLETKQKVNTMEPSESLDVMDGHMCRVFALQYNPKHPHVFISGGWDDTVQYWDDRQQHSIKKFNGPHICGDALDIDPVHNHILTGSWRKRAVLQIWDFAMAVKIKDVPQDSLTDSQLYCAQWLGKDSIVCGGNDHNMARVIDRGTLNTTGMLVELPQGVYCIDNDRHPNRPSFAIGSSRFIYRLRRDKTD